MTSRHWLRAISSDLRLIHRGAGPRLLFLIGSLPADMVGGAQVQAERAAAELSDRFDVVVLSRSVRVAPGAEQRATYQVLRRPVLDMRGLRPLADLAMCLWQIARLREGAVCVVGYQTLLTGLAAVLAGRLLRIPSLVSIRSDGEFRADVEHPITRMLSRLTWALADRIVVQSHSLAGQFVLAAERLGMHRSKLLPRLGVVPNGIDAVSPTDEKQGDGLVFVGRLHESKGLDVLIEALRQMPESERPRLVVVGGGTLLGDLQRCTVDLRVQLVGETSHERALQYMRDSATFVFPVKADGMSNAVMEAMAIGLPIIATRVGGVPDLIVDGESGLLVPPGDATALHHAIKMMMTDTELRTRLGTAARRAVASHSWARSRRDLEEQITLARAKRRRG